MTPKDKDSVYISPDRSFLMNKSNELIGHFRQYAQAAGLKPEEISIQEALPPRIIQRVSKREDYFKYFHKGMQINEIKQAALVAYWILKFRPFMVTSDDPQRTYKGFRVNEGFALFYILGACKEYAHGQGHPMEQLSERLSDSLRNELLYAFTYWDISKEAVILIAETLAETLCNIPAQGV